MPEYKKIRAKNLRQAREIAFKKYGSNISIVKEILQQPKGWKKLLKLSEPFCEIVVARYNNRKNSILDDVYPGSLKDLDNDVDVFSSEQILDKTKQRKSLKNPVKKSLVDTKNTPEVKHKNFTEMLDKKSKQISFNLSESKHFHKMTNVDDQNLRKARDFKKTLVGSDNDNDVSKAKVGVIEEFLLKCQFDALLAKDVGNICLVDDLNSTENLKHLAFTLSSRFSFSEDFFHSPSIQFYFFLGAPGVGKTTSVFKVAVELAKKQKRDVFLACYDQNRLMASAQMEKFANILELPFRHLDGVKCLQRLKNECVEGSVVLVDLAGISLSEKNQFDEYLALMNVVEDQKKVLLTLHSAMSKEVLSLQMKMFSLMNVDALSFSHVDEVETLGPILSVADHFKKSIALFCLGQDVPHDMRWANKTNLEQLLLKFWSSRGVLF